MLLNLFILSVVVFVSIGWIKQDPIEALLAQSGEMGLSTEAYEEAYLRLQRQYGYDKAPFYISIGSMASDPKFRTLSPNKSAFVHAILHQTANPEAMHSFLKFSEAHFSKKKLQTIYSKRSLDELKALQGQAEFGQEYTEALGLILQQRSRIWHFVPRIVWNGFQNRYHQWLGRVFRGDLGSSLVDTVAVNRRVYEAFRWTFLLNLTALFVVFAAGILLGLWIGYSRLKFFRMAVTGLSFLFYAVPVFWLATVLVVFFTTDEYSPKMNIFPSVGLMYDCDSSSVLRCFVQNLRYMFLPLLCMILPSLAYVIRQIYMGVLSEQNKNYVSFAKSLGFSRPYIFFRRVLPNVLTPVITLVGTAIPALLSGSLIIEIIFNIPGMGRLLYQSLLAQDWDVVLILVLLSAIFTMLAYFLVDILYARFNPRVELR